MSAIQLRVGFEIIYNFYQPTPLILVVNIHDSRASDIIVRDNLTTVPSVPVSAYIDAFGNQCNRVLAPPGRLTLMADAVIKDNGPDRVPIGVSQDAVENLPEDTLMYLLGSRY